jgi:hypothetical protein
MGYFQYTIYKNEVEVYYFQEIEKVIKSFETKNSSGYDEITSIIIKASLPYITSPLTFICNAVLHYNVFPDNAVVKPCFKKGSRLEMTASAV